MDSSAYILVVDDDPAIQDFVSMALSDEGYNITTAPDGATALKFASQSLPLLILLDIRMPTMDGRTFLENYHATAGPHAPIIILTASRGMEASIDSLNVADFLAKPFDLNDLLMLVKKYAAPE